MAVRGEDLERVEARIFRFPTASVRAVARRDRMLARRRRAATTTVVLAVAAATLLGSGSSVASRPGAPAAVTVAPGQTLWDLGRRYAPEGVDRRAYVDAIVATNNLDGPPVVGQRLRLPQ